LVRVEDKSSLGSAIAGARGGARTGPMHTEASWRTIDLVFDDDTSTGAPKHIHVQFAKELVRPLHRQ
jgi:hypothetical protein